jgi:predicted outer membrane repeat protein
MNRNFPQLFPKLAIILLFCFTTQLIHAQKYVTVGGAGNLDGSTWANALDTAKFRDGLHSAAAGDAYWIAAGTYTPANSRDSSFEVPVGVKLYGGFSATDTTWASRNWKKNKTIFSGDVGNIGDSTDNNHHVVYTHLTDTSTRFDGLIITLGNANGAGNNRDVGGGIYNDGQQTGFVSSVSIVNCIFTRNYASNYGGGFFDNGQTDGKIESQVINSIFYANRAGNGGGIAVNASGGSNTGAGNTKIYNCVFVENTCVQKGGAIYSRAVVGTVDVINCTFTKNYSPNGGFSGNGSSVYARSGTTNIKNCITVNNSGTDLTKDPAGSWNVDHCITEGSYFGATNLLIGNPFFKDSNIYEGADGMWATADDGLTLKEGSLGVNGGLNSYVNATVMEDVQNAARLHANTVDMGAYESYFDCPKVTIKTNNISGCISTSFTFTASTLFATGPQSKNFEWRVNGSKVGIDDSTFTSSNLFDGDSVSCYLTSTQACTYPKGPTSNKFRMQVEVPSSAQISGGTCTGDTLHAAVPYNSSWITWTLGGSPVGYSTSQGYDYGTGAAGDSTGITAQDSTKLASPRGISRDALGNLYIADRNNAKILKWPVGGSTYGTTVAGSKVGGVGNDSSMLNIPVDVFRASDNKLYIADSGANRIHRWDEGGTYGTTVAGSSAGTAGADSVSLSGPTGVFVDFLGNIYVADYNNNRVQKWAVGASYGVTVAGSPTGASGSDSSKLNGPASVWVDKNQNVYVSDQRNNRVQKWALGATYGITVAGDSTGTIGSDSLHLNAPAAIHLDRNDVLYISDMNNHRVMKLVPNINYMIRVAGDGTAGLDSASVSHPWGMDIDTYTGDVYVSDQDNNRIQRWTQILANDYFIAKNAGTYSIDVTSIVGCPLNGGNLNVVQGPNPSLSVSGSNTLCPGNTASLSTSSVSTYTYSWYMNGTSAVNLSPNPYDFTALDSGDYYVVAKDTVQGCSGVSNTLHIYIDSIPNIQITYPNNGKICTGDSIKIDAIAYNPNNTITWYAGANLNVLATNVGTYYATKADTIFAVVVNANQCGNAVMVIVTEETPVTPSISNVGVTSFCQGDSVLLYTNSSAGYTYQWWFNGNAINGAADTMIYASASGSYQVSGTSSLGCSATSTATAVTVNSIPSSSVSATGNTTFCQGDSVLLDVATTAGASYQWQLNGSNINGATSASYYANASGTYTATVLSSSGCTSTSATGVSVTVNASPTATAAASGATTFCAGDSVKLTASAGANYTYQWMESGSAINGATGIIYYVKTSGTYAVQVSVSGCSSVSTSVTVTVNGAPNASVTPSANQTFCQGDSVVLTAPSGGSYAYQWYKGASKIGPATNVTFVAKASGTYSVEISQSGCTSKSAGVVVTVNALPTIPVVTKAGNVLSSTAASGYQWYKDGVIINGATSQTYTATASGKYRVEITDANGCKNISTLFNFNGVDDIQQSIYVRITPNPSNGLFTLNVEGVEGATQVIIYNLTGKEVMRKSYRGVMAIDLSEQAAGVYLVNVLNNQHTATVKVIKE